MGGPPVRTCVEFIADLKRVQDLERDADVARYLGLSRAGVHKILKKKNLYGDEVAAKVARGLGLETEFVIRCRNVERLTVQKERLEEAIQRSLKRLAAGVGALLVAVGIGAPRPADAAAQFDNYKIMAACGRSPSSGPIYSLCANLARRLARIARATLAAITRGLMPTPGAALGAL
jgi:plasmid maintenance system antidote protein VapI